MNPDPSQNYSQPSQTDQTQADQTQASQTVQPLVPTSYAPPANPAPETPSIDKVSSDYISSVNRDGTTPVEVLKDPSFQAVLSSMPKPVAEMWRANYAQSQFVLPSVNYIPPSTFTPLSTRTIPVGAARVFEAATQTNTTSRLVDMAQEAWASIGDTQTIDVAKYFTEHEKELKSTPAGQYVWYNQYLTGNYDTISSPNRLLATIANDMARFGYMQTLGSAQGFAEHAAGFAGNVFDPVPLAVSLGAAGLVAKLAGAGVALTAEEVASVNQAQSVIKGLKAIPTASRTAEQISALAAAERTVQGFGLTSNALNTTLDGIAGTSKVTGGTNKLTSLGSFLQTEAGMAAWWATGEPVLQAQEPDRTKTDALKALGENLAVGAILYGAGKAIGLGLRKAGDYLITKPEAASTVSTVEAPPEIAAPKAPEVTVEHEFRTDSEKFLDDVMAGRMPSVEIPPVEVVPVDVSSPDSNIDLTGPIGEFKASIEDYVRQLSEEPQHTSLISDLNDLLISIDRAEAKGHFPEKGHDLINIIKELSDNATSQTTRLAGSEIPAAELQSFIRQAQDKINSFHDAFEQKLVEQSGVNPNNAALAAIKDQLPAMVKALRTRLLDFSNNARISLNFSNLSEAVDTFLSDQIHGFDFADPEYSLGKLDNALRSFGDDVHINDGENIEKGSARQRLYQSRINIEIGEFKAIIEDFQASVTDAVNKASLPPAPGLSTEVAPPALPEGSPAAGEPPVEHVNVEPVSIEEQAAKETAKLDAIARELAVVDAELASDTPAPKVADLKNAVDELSSIAKATDKSVKRAAWQSPLWFTGIFYVSSYLRLYHRLKMLTNRLTHAAGENNAEIVISKDAYKTSYDKAITWLQDPKTVAKLETILQNIPGSQAMKDHLEALKKIDDSPQARGDWSSKAFDLLLSHARDQQIQNKNLSVASDLVIKSAANAYSNLIGPLNSVGSIAGMLSSDDETAKANYKLIAKSLDNVLGIAPALKVKSFDSFIKGFVTDVAHDLPTDAALVWSKIANQAFRQLSDLSEAQVSGVNGKGSDYLAQLSVNVIGKALSKVLADAVDGKPYEPLTPQAIQSIIENSAAKEIINRNLIDRADDATKETMNPRLSLYMPSNAKDLLVYVGLMSELKAKGTLDKAGYDALWQTLPVSDMLALGQLDSVLSARDRKSTDFYHVVGQYLNNARLLQNTPANKSIIDIPQSGGFSDEQLGPLLLKRGVQVLGNELMNLKQPVQPDKRTLIEQYRNKPVDLPMTPLEKGQSFMNDPELWKYKMTLPQPQPDIFKEKR